MTQQEKINTINNSNNMQSKSRLAHTIDEEYNRCKNKENNKPSEKQRKPKYSGFLYE